MSARVAASVRRGFARLGFVFFTLGIAIAVVCGGIAIYGGLSEPTSKQLLVDWREYQKKNASGPWGVYVTTECQRIMATDNYEDNDKRSAMELGYGYPTIYKCDPKAEPLIHARIAEDKREAWVEPLQFAGGSFTVGLAIALFFNLTGWVLAGFIPD